MALDLDGKPFENPKLFKAIKALVFCVLLFLFFTTSFIINILQLINYVVLGQLFPDVRRFFNGYLQNVIQTSFIYVFEWQCPINFRVSFESTETMNLFCRGENGMLIVNHAYPLDIFFYFVFGQATNSLNAIKGFAKSTIKYMPIVGWMSYFNDTIFLDRNWQTDEQVINKCLAKLKKSRRPYKLMIAPEGTRYTEEKYRISQEFIKKHNLSVNLKHHLLPRVKGFAATLRQLQAKQDPHFALYNVEFLTQIDNHFHEPTLKNFFLGKPFKVDVFVGRVPESYIPPPDSDDQSYADFLYSIFEFKDRLVAEHKEYNRFPQSVVRMRRPSAWRFFKFFLFNIAMTGSMIVYGTYLAFLWQSVLMKLAISTYIVGSLAVIAATFNMAQISKYGTDKSD